MAKKKSAPIEAELVSTPKPKVAKRVKQTTPKMEVAELSKVTDQQTGELAIVGGVSTDNLKIALAVQTEQRQLIKDFIQSHLVDGVDFGRIHVVKDCPDKYACKKDYHYSKRVLFKPGQEKIFSLFQIKDKLEKDIEAYEMLGNMQGLVAFKCTLYRQEKEVGHGRGAAVLNDKGRDANSTIKIAEKRARMDACLSLGFSEYFAQDLDDPDYKSQAEMANQQVAAAAARVDKDEFGLWPAKANDPINNDERRVLFQMIKDAGYFKNEDILNLLRANGIKTPEKMKSGEARIMMMNLRDGIYTAVPVQASMPKQEEPHIEPDPNFTEDELVGVDEPQLKEPPEPVPLVIDDDFRQAVKSEYESLGLNNRGKMWFMRNVAGKPYGDWLKFTDADWERASEWIESIKDGSTDVHDEFIAGLVAEPEKFSDEDMAAKAFAEDTFNEAQPATGKEAASGDN